MAHRNSWLLGLLLLSAGSFAQQPAQEQPPGNERVCVPGENGRGWVCGTRDHPPQVNSPPPPARSVPEPPPFLADPSRRTRTSAVPRTQPAQVQPIADKQATAPEALPDSAPATAAASAPAKGKHKNTDARSMQAPKAVVAAPASGTVGDAARAEPASITQAANIDDAPVAVESLPEPASTTSAPSDSVPSSAAAQTSASTGVAHQTEMPTPEPAPATIAGGATSGAEGLAALPGAEFTVQLSRSRSTAALDALVRELKLNPDSTYRLSVNVDGGVEHLLLWSHFDDLGKARAALASLPHAKIKGAWVRKISEVRALAAQAGDAGAATTVAATSAPEATPTPTPSAAPTAEPAPTSVAQVETRAPRTASDGPAAVLGNASDFLHLAPTHFAVQLARAHSSTGFAPLIAALELREGAAYTIELQLGSRRDFVLLWADFPDLASARAAAARLPANRVSGALPRRIGPLQDELRRAAP